MQTITGELANTLGGIQTALLSPDQLVPGVIITGTLMQQAWLVLSAPRDGKVEMLKQPAAPQPAGHVHTITVLESGTQQCPCGWRNQVLGGTRGLLPVRPDTPKVFVVAPAGPIIQPDRFSVYATGAGRIITFSREGSWNSNLPIIPGLVKVWTLPEALRALLVDG